MKHVSGWVFGLALLGTWAATVEDAQAGGEIRVNAGVQVQPPAPRYRRRPGPRWMVPLRLDIGGLVMGSERGTLTGAELALGINWASLSPQPTDFDVGIGVLAGFVGGARDDVTSDGDNVSFSGAYLEAGHTLSRGDFWRTWATGRGEYLNSNAFGGETSTSVGVSAKVSAELYISGVGLSPDGIFLGTYAIGVYAEVARRELGPDVGNFQASLGLSFRTPLVWSP